MRAALPIGCLWLAACRAGGSATVPDDSDPPTYDTAGITDTDTTDTTDTDTEVTTDTDDTANALTACAQPRPTTWSYYGWVPPTEEFTFDDVGNLINISEDTNVIWRSPAGGPAEIVVPYSSSEVAGVRFLLDGDLVVANEFDGSLDRVGLDGSRAPLLGGLDNPNSVAVDEDGFIYTTAADQVLRVDPSSGAQTLLFELPGADLDGLVFSPDFSLLYYNSDETGDVGQIEVDDLGVGTNRQTISGINLPWGEQLDGATVDACGNLYVVRTDGLIRRIFPDHTAQDFIWVTRAGGLKTTSAQFGSGIGGWERDHLYVMDREGGLFDIDVGIDGAWQPHLPFP